MEGFLVRLKVAGCGARYQIAWPKHYFDWQQTTTTARRFVAVQIEADRSIHLIPETASDPVDVAAYAEHQETGFPCTPYEIACDE